MASFSGVVTFVFVLLRLRSMLSLKPRPFVQSSFDMQLAVVCPKVTGRTKKRILSQSKRARAGSLALVE